MAIINKIMFISLFITQFMAIPASCMNAPLLDENVQPPKAIIIDLTVFIQDLTPPKFLTDLTAFFKQHPQLPLGIIYACSQEIMLQILRGLSYDYGECFTHLLYAAHTIRARNITSRAEQYKQLVRTFKVNPAECIVITLKPTNDAESQEHSLTNEVAVFQTGIGHILQLEQKTTRKTLVKKGSSSTPTIRQDLDDHSLQAALTHAFSE